MCRRREIVFGIITAAISLLALVCPNPSYSATMRSVVTSTYFATDYETPVVADKRAFLLARLAALEEALPYVKDAAMLRSIELSKDELEAVSFAILQADVTGRETVTGQEGDGFKVEVSATVDTGTIEGAVKSLRAKSAVVDYRRLRSVYDANTAEIKDLMKGVFDQSVDHSSLEDSIRANERLFQSAEWIEKGYRYFVLDSQDKAVQACSNAIKLAPSSAGAFACRSRTYAVKGDVSRALDDINRACSLSPADQGLFLDRGILLLAKGRVDDAIADLNRYISEGAVSTAAFLYRGNAEFDKGLYDQAIEDYGKSIALDPSNAQSRYMRGASYYMKNDTAKALPDLRMSCDLGDKEGCAMFALLSKRNN